VGVKKRGANGGGDDQCYAFLVLFILVIFGGITVVLSAINSPILWGLFGFVVFFAPVAVDAAIDVYTKNNYDF
jgi:hypothetical protein